MEAVQASERQIPCGLCGGSVPESAFRSGAARMFQGVLYCPTCSREADRAKLETVAFKQSLEAGGLYTCGRCSSPVPIADIRSGAVIYFSGVLSCSKCSLDLRNILKGRPDAPPGARSQRFQKSELGQISPPSQRFDANQLRSSQTSGSQRLMPRTDGVAAGTQRFAPRPESAPPPGRNSQRFAPPAGEGSQRFAPPAGEGSQRFAPPAGEGSQRFVTPSTGTPRAAPSEPGAGASTSRRITGPQPKVTLEPGRSGPLPRATASGVGGSLGEAVVCAGCDARIAPEDVASGRALVKGRESYCPTCRDRIDNILRSSADELADLTKFSCASCGKPVTAEDLLEERGVRYRGQVYCGSCKADFGRTANPQQAQARGPAATLMPDVSCARCDKKIPPVDIRTGKTLDVGGRLHCRHCRVELEEQQKKVEKRLAKAVSCAHCSRAITPKEIKDKKVTQHEGNVYCAICSKDVGVVLFGRESGDPDREGVCRGCGGALGAGSQGDVCGTCQARLHKAAEEASEELERTQTIPCDKCETPITLDEISSWKAGFDDGKVLCLKCQHAATQEKRQKPRAAARCSRCRGPLPEGRQPGPDVVCDKCLAVSVEDDKDTEAAVSLSGEVELKCATCRRAISREDLIEKRAQSIGGKLRCANCKAKAVTAPAPAKGKPCGACEKPIAGAPFVFGGRNFCTSCKPEFEKILKGAALKGSKPCTSCKKTAQGEGALEIEGKAFCASCKRASDYLVMATVSQRRQKPPREAPPVALVGGIVALAVVVALVMVVKTFLGGERPGGPTSTSTGNNSPSPAPTDAPRTDTVVIKAAVLTRGQPRTYEEAAKIVKQLEELKAEAPPSEAPALADYVAKATLVRDRFVPLKVDACLEEATTAYRKHEAPGEALAVLNAVPPEILQTRDGARVVQARERYTQLGNCLRRAETLMASTAEDKYQPMGQLLASSEARNSGFLETKVGRDFESAYRLALNAWTKTHPTTPADPLQLKAAERAESGRSYQQAWNAYDAYVKTDSDNPEALFGLARCSLELEKREDASRVLQRLESLGKSNPAVPPLLAWFAWLNGKGIEPSILASLKRPPAELGHIAQRLQAVAKLGTPAAQGASWRLWAPGASPEVLEKAEQDLTATIDRLATAYGVRDNKRIEVFLFRDDSETRELRKQLDVLDGASEGRLPGCFGVAVTDPLLVKPAIARALLARSATRGEVPKWITESVPEVVGLNFVSLSPPPPSGKRPEPVPPPPLTLEELEKVKDFKANQKAVDAARQYAHLVNDGEGCARLEAYVAGLKADPKKARAELEAYFAKFRAKQIDNWNPDAK